MSYLDGRTPNASDVRTAFADAMRRRGLIPPNDLIVGKLQRCRVEGARPGKRDGVYKLYLDEHPAGGFRNWKDGRDWEDWHYSNGNGATTWTPAERAAFGAQVAARKKTDEEKNHRLAEAARREAVALFGNAALADLRHPYLVKKQVRPHGLRQRGSELLVPRSDMVTGELVNLQRILPDGTKLNLKNGRADNTWFVIGKPQAQGTILLAEGFATAATGNEVTGHPAVVSFGSDNLKAAAVELRKQHPQARIVILADDDWKQKDNPGLTKAKEAALAANALLAMPQFGPDRGDKDTDFNDMRRLVGADAVGTEIENAARVKPRLLVDTANPDRTVAALRDILRTSGGLYDRGTPVRLAFDQAQRGMVAQVLTPDVLVLLAHSVCRPYRVKKKADGPEVEDTRLPRDIATMYLDWKGEWQLPVLNGIASAPMLKDDGTILATAGYDQASGMWCDDLPALGGQVPEAPTKDEAGAALASLRKNFRTFCFADAETVFDSEADVAVVEQERPIGHDESAMLAGLLTAVCRPSLDLAPAFVMEAPSISGAGTGKGMLARCMSLIAFGREPHAVTGGGDSKETDKRIAAELMEAHPMLFLDNLNNAAFKSDLLASVITERPSRVRVLGLSKMVLLNASAFVVLTGNGLSVAEDLARRVITVRLDAKTEDPEARPFKANLRAEVLAKRPELLAALLTIWRWGRRTTLPSGKPLGSFERWSRWVRDPLLALGCKDVVEQVSRAKARDAERQFVGELFETWRDRHGDSPVAIRNLHEDVSKILDPQGRGRQFIASKVRKLIDTRAAGFTLTRQAGSGKWSTTTYALKSAGDPEGHRGHRGRRPEGSTPVPPEHNGAAHMPPMAPMHSSASAEANAGNSVESEASTAPDSPDPTQSASSKPSSVRI